MSDEWGGEVDVSSASHSQWDRSSMRKDNGLLRTDPIRDF